MTIYTHNGKAIIVNGKAIAMRTAQPDTYTPILPTDATAFPLYLEGWAKYTVTQVTTIGSNDVAYVETGIDGKNPSTCFCSDYDGIVNTTSLSNTRNKTAKYGFTTASMRDRCYLKDTDVGTTVSEWNAYLASHPIDVLFELETSDNSLWFAVARSRDGACGYYNPATGEFFAAYGMSGTVIERVEYVSFDGSQYVNSAVNLLGSDTVIIDFTNKKSGDNVFGSWHSNNQNVYTMYASSASSYVRYNSALYRNTPIPLNTRLVFKMTPTGDYVDDTRYHTWEEGSFNTGTPCLVGWLDGSGSPKLEGDVYSFAIDGKSSLVPVKVGTAYYLFDTTQWGVPTHSGTLTGGSVIEEEIEFPESIYHDPVMLMMGGNPNPEPEPEPEGGDEE